MHKKHAIIIGAGPAGLTAAYYLAKGTDIKPIVLEKEKFIGGLARTINFDGNLMDIGGHEFFSKSEEISKLWNELLTDDEKIFQQRREPKIFYRQKIFPYPTSLNLQTIKNFGLGEIFSIGASFLKRKFSRREEKTLEDFLINRFGEKFYEIFFRDYTIKFFGRPPEEIDAALNVQIFETPPEKFFRPKFGSGHMWEKMSDEIKKLGGEVLTSTNVKSFHVVGNVIKSARVESPAGLLTFPADYFLSSMPLTELAEALDDGLNLRQLQIARGLVYRDLIVVGFRGEKNLRDEKIFINEPSAKVSCVEIFNNQICMEYFCEAGDDLWQMSDDDFIKFAADELATLGIVGEVQSGVRVNVPKAYPAYFDTYENISELRGVLNEIKNLYSIGRGGQHRCNNMERSMLTAIAAVCAIVGKFSKSDIWI